MTFCEDGYVIMKVQWEDGYLQNEDGYGQIFNSKLMVVMLNESSLPLPCRVMMIKTIDL